MLTQADQLRSEYQATRYALLTEDCSEAVLEFIKEQAGDEVVGHWGAPDTALNPMAATTRQLVTPGLYGRKPTIHATADAEELIGPDGAMDAARIWSRNQWVAYLTVGIGIVFRRLSRVDGRLVDRVVLPQNVCVDVAEDDPTRIVRLCELRTRRLVEPDGTYTAYCWDVWEIGPDENGVPQASYRVYRARSIEGRGGLGDDISARLLSASVDGDLVFGALTTQAGTYEWLDEAGEPFLPWNVRRAVDTGTFWPVWRRGMHSGSFRALAYWTYTGHSALFATGEHHILTGVDLSGMAGAVVSNGPKGAQSGSAQPAASIRFHPNTMTSIPLLEGQTMQSLKIGPGVNLPNLASWANQYHLTLAIGDGLQPSDATRQSANPTSGAALEISAASRREFSVQVAPLFRDADLELIRICALLLVADGISVPTRGYAITYHTIPLSPTEQEDLRAELEWEEENGQVSPIDVHLRLNPGKTRAQALADIVAARADAVQIDTLVAAELVTRGVAPAAPPRPPPPPPPTNDDPANTDPEG